MTANRTWLHLLTAGVFLCSLYLLNWQPYRTNFLFITVFYSLAFGAYAVLISQHKRISFQLFVGIAVLAQLVSMIYEPNLSIDYYRFLWDGEMTWHGINPFDFTPDELKEQGFVNTSYLQEIYNGLGSLSSSNYSCYPTINQGYFILSTAFSSSVAFNTFVMKLLILITEIVGAVFLRKLLIHFEVNPARMWMLYLNPLWIIECTGNVHFEGVMISFLFIAFYFIFIKKLFLGGGIFALAVQVKLIPLMLLPFFYRYLGIAKSALFYTIVFAVAIGFGLIHLHSGNIDNFVQSLALYFKVFEFNSFIFYNYLQYGKPIYGYNPIRIYGPRLSRIALMIIMTLALYGQITDWKKMFKRMMFGFFAFLMLSGTLHPWYILPMLALSMFTNYSFPMVWSYLIFFSYFFYHIGSGSSFEVRTMVTVEYVILIGLFLYEVMKSGSPFRAFRIDRYFQPVSGA